MNSGCRGCVAYTKEIGLSCNGDMNKDNVCPCSDCLIKGMCTDECPEYSKFSIYVYERQKRESDKLEVDYFNAETRKIK
jgi:hypothetical protein